MLHEQYPGSRFEVLNVAMRGIDSHLHEDMEVDRAIGSGSCRVAVRIAEAGIPDGRFLARLFAVDGIEIAPDRDAIGNERHGPIITGGAVPAALIKIIRPSRVTG